MLYIFACLRLPCGACGRCGADEFADKLCLKCVCVMEIRAHRSSSSSFGRLKPQSSLPLRSECPIFLGTLSAVIRTSASSPSYEHGTDRSIPSLSRHQNQGCRRGCGDVPLSLSDFGRAFFSLSRSGRPAPIIYFILSSRQPLFEKPNPSLTQRLLGRTILLSL
jgi:hypothetical protein